MQENKVNTSLLLLPGGRGAGYVLKKIISLIITIVVILLAALAALICRSVFWALKTWSDLSMEEIIYHLRMPMEGTNSDMIHDYIGYCVVISIVVACVLIGVFILIHRRRAIYHIARGVTAMLALLIGLLSFRYFWNTLDVSEYVENQSTYSSFIDDNYVDPTSVELGFPEEKRNLIYIFLESMENTYADQENGGAFEQNVIPELTELSKENENFSGAQDILNGGYALKGATWTIGAMFAQTSGLPLSIPIDMNSMSTQEEFFPGTTVLGDILEDEGYCQALLIGSDVAFGGRKLYFSQHGDYELYDYNHSLEQGEIPEDYYVWWGYEDEILFENAKNKLNILSNSDEPFNLTILTVDTHFEDGYKCSLCQDEYGEDQYSNVMACSSRQVAEFVKWVQEQPFYENTTIVISGDHLTMDSDYCDDVDPEYERKVYTTYINSAVAPEESTFREYSTFDAFPTTLASLGVDIPGNRLGLGVNLFSAEQTLVEKYGIDEVNKGLGQKSELMDRLIAGVETKLMQIDVDFGEDESEKAVVTVSNIHWGEGMTGIYCGIWSQKDQSDIKWYVAEEQANGDYAAEVPISDFTYGDTTYNIHVYSKMKGDMANIYMGSTTVKVGSVPGQDNSEEHSSISDISADIEIEPYDYRVGKFDVYLKNLTTDKNIMSIRCAVWSDENQDDLWWYEGELLENGDYVVHVYASDFQYRETVYNVHMYAIDDTGNSIMVAASYGEIN